jgi:YHS domain-containing protein
VSQESSLPLSSLHSLRFTNSRTKGCARSRKPGYTNTAIIGLRDLLRVWLEIVILEWYFEEEVGVRSVANKTPICRRLSLIVLTTLMTSFPIFCLADDEIVISSCLMRGYGRPAVSLRSDSRNSSIIERPFLQIPAYEKEPGGDTFACVRDSLSSIYQFPSVLVLTSALMIWDGKKENLNEAVIPGDMHVYPIQFYFRSLKDNLLSLRIEGFKFRFGEIRYLRERERLKRELVQDTFELFTETRKIEDSIGGEKWLDSELTLPLGAPMLLALPGMDHSYFLAIRAYKKDTRQFSIGLMNTKLLYFNVSDADPVCGRIVGRGDGIEKRHTAQASLTYKGYTFLFCSQACREKFREDPEACLKKSKTKYFKQITFTKNPSFIEVRRAPPYSEELTALQPSLLVWPIFPENCREKAIHGTVKAEMCVGKSGNILEVRALEPLLPDFVATVAKALHQWKFNPISSDRGSEEVVYHVDMNFTIGQEQPASVSNVVLESQPQPKAVLQKAADYCRRLEEAALSFVCIERIKETVSADNFLMPFIVRRWPPEMRRIIAPDGTLALTDNEYSTRDEYVYDYQLIHREGQVVERRIFMEGGEGHENEGSPRQELRRIYFSKPIFAPIGLLSPDFQPLYDYSGIKEDAVDGRESWVLDIKPRKVTPGKPNYGKAWVDKQNGSILKMEIDAESIEGFQRLREDYVDRGIKPVFSIETLFGFEKKGLRYPSRMAIEEAYSDPKNGRTRVSRTTVDYEHYKFFIVETGDRVK